MILVSDRRPHGPASPVNAAARRTFLLALVAAASSAMAQTPLCDSLAALDPPGEVTASPRDSRDAELLTLMASRGAAADSDLYETVQEDLEFLLSLRPDLAELPVRPRAGADSLFVIFISPEARDAAQNGELEDFECLNELLDLESATYYNIIPKIVFLSFDGRYRSETVGAAYEQVPGASSFSLNHSFPGPAGCFYRRADGGRVYFFEEWIVPYPGAYPVLLVRAELDRYGGVSFVDAIPPYEPALEEEYEACLTGLLDVPDPLASVEIPTLSGAALAGFALLLAAAGLGASVRRRSGSTLR